MGLGREGDSLCGTRGSWELRAGAEPFRFKSPRSPERSEKRPDATGEPENHSETFHYYRRSQRGRSPEPDQGGGREVGTLDKILGSTVKVSTKDRSTLQVFLRATGGSPEASLLVSELLSGQRLQGEMERHGLQLGMCLSRPSSGDFVGQRAICALQEHVERDRPLCIVMSPTHSRLLDLLVEIVTGQLQIGRHFVCTTPTNSSLEYNRSLKAPRSIRGVHTVVADGCAFGCRCVMMEFVVAAGWQFVRTLPQLARKMFF